MAKANPAWGGGGWLTHVKSALCPPAAIGQELQLNNLEGWNLKVLTDSAIVTEVSSSTMGTVKQHKSGYDVIRFLSR